MSVTTQPAPTLRLLVTKTVLWFIVGVAAVVAFVRYTQGLGVTTGGRQGQVPIRKEVADIEPKAELVVERYLCTESGVNRPVHIGTEGVAGRAHADVTEAGDQEGLEFGR